MRAGVGDQLPLPFGRGESGGLVSVAGVAEGVEFVRHRRARHYILRVRDDGGLRITVPRGGSRAAAERFLRERRDWIRRERLRRARAAGGRTGPWRDGTLVLMRGAEVPLSVTSVDSRLRVQFADQALTVPAADADRLRARIEAHLRRVAAAELRARLEELADAHGFAPGGVTIRNQRTRWGSCSPSGRISINWRLIQVPPDVRDYVLLHELTHLRHANHSGRFWKALAGVCPGHAEARRWLRSARLLEC